MTIAISVGILSASLLVLVLADRGIYNVLDMASLALHRAAVRGRARHAVHAERLSAQWQEDI